MKDLFTLQYFKNKTKFQIEVLHLITPIINKYKSINDLILKDEYLNNYKNCGNFSKLLKFTQENINSKIINLTQQNKNLFYENINQFDYLDILENKPEYNIGVFLIPKGSRIPLHDHPNILVISKIIFGNVLIKSYDRIKKGENKEENFFPVDERNEVNLKINDIGVLTPEYNNIHEVYAIEDSAFFDILIPAYDENNYRICNYYEIIEKKINCKDKIYLKKL